MDSLCGDTEESAEDISGRKKSKIKSLKTRLFGRNKKAGGEGNAKLSQSASDIMAGKGVGSEEDLACSQGMMGSRALSCDSVFLSDQVLTDAEPARVLSQENVHSKIKVLQMKLQQQKLHLGPPPMVLQIRRPEDVESRREDDSHPHSPPEIAGLCFPTLTKTLSQPLCHPLSPTLKPATQFVAQTPPHPLPPSVLSSSSVDEPPLDFSSPAQFTPCLDTSAARHRLSVKPRNQRASNKRRLPTTDSKSYLHPQNNNDHPHSAREEEFSSQKGVTLETEQVEAASPVTSQCCPSKFPEVAPVTPETTSTSSSLHLSQQDQALPGRVPSVPSQVLRVKPYGPADGTRSERPHSSFIPSEVKNKTEGLFEIPVMSHDKINTLNKTGMPEVSSDQVSAASGSVVALRSSSVQQQFQGDTESTKVLKRPAPGSGSFHFSITSAKKQDGERPRSGSFAGVLERTEGRYKTEEKPFSSMRQKAELRDLVPRGEHFSVGALHKSSIPPWDKKDSLKKVELATLSKNVTTDAAAAEVEEGEITQEVGEEAAAAQVVQEDEVKTAFGIKLRSTSQSIRLRSGASLKQNSKSPVCEEQCDKQKKQETSDYATYMCKKPSTNISTSEDLQPPSTSEDLQVTAPSSFSTPVKNNPPIRCDPPIMPRQLQTTSSNHEETETVVEAPQETQSAPQTAPSEVSWMSLAMEKTRSLQQLFTSRFPRDFPGVQAAARPQPETLTGAQIQTAKQPLAHAVKAETVQSPSQAQFLKLKTSTTSPIQANTSREPHISKQTNEPQSHPNTTPSASPSVQTHLQITQSPLQTDTSSQSGQASVTQSLAQFYLFSGQQQSPWSNRVLQPANKSTNSAPPTASSTSSATAPSTVSTTSSATAPPTVPTISTASAPPTVSTISSVPAPTLSTISSVPAPALSTISSVPAPTLSTISSVPALALSTISSVPAPALSAISPVPAPPTVSIISLAPAPPTAYIIERGERKATLQDKEGASFSGRRAVWTGSVSEKAAAFLEKQVEWTTPPGTKGVEVRKTQIEEQTLGEAPASAKTTPLSTDAKPNGRQGLKPTESSPIKVPEGPHDNKWLRKNVPSSSLSLSPPTMQSAFQSASDSGQPSWMELAKRKSMAWSDKTMD